MRGILTRAACQPNPGPATVQGIDIETGDVLFNHDIGVSTNNVAEYIAIAAAISYVLSSEEQDVATIYSTSKTAIAWFLNNGPSTSHGHTAPLQRANELIGRHSENFEVRWMAKAEWEKANATAPNNTTEEINSKPIQNMFNITGILKVIGTEQQVSEKFRKREFVLTDNSSQNHPQHISFQLSQDKCGLLDSHNVGSEIKVHFNLRGREWTDKQGVTKYFNSLEAWKIEALSQAAQETTGTASYSNSPVEDDLPF